MITQEALEAMGAYYVSQYGVTAFNESDYFELIIQDETPVDNRVLWNIVGRWKTQVIPEQLGLETICSFHTLAEAEACKIKLQLINPHRDGSQPSWQK